MPNNPVHTPDNWGDRTLASAKLTYYPIKGFKLLSSFNHSRNQYSLSRLNMNYFLDGMVNENHHSGPRVGCRERRLPGRRGLDSLYPAGLRDVA